MCKLFDVSRSYYYKVINKEIIIDEAQLNFDDKVKIVFNNNYKICGSRKIDVRLKETFPELTSSR
ncbi:MAG: hypothetical protein ACK5HR_06515 [Mycoplasmatales bacterium]